MLEITADDIAGLADDDLRTLVARLCEAEMRRRALSPAAVTWGGDQNAADGGIDVRVDLPTGTLVDGFIPRPETGFQVKKSDMPAGSIADEMSPDGVIRPSIQALADAGGAYIIVSSNGSTSDSALKDRRDAMASAVKGIRNGASLWLDFYDRTRIASWVRDNPALVPWVRRLAGRPIAGWQSYGPWANPSEDVSAEYLLDDGTRIRTGKKEDDQGLTAEEGLNRMRGTLRTPGNAVRLVGLSGVGKTRFIQALFDGRIGEDSLDPSLALYTNMNDAPDPSPVAMVSELVISNTRVVVVVDNCPPDLHRRLVEVSKATTSRVSLATVEYDIREDQPELTDVYKMEPSSGGTVERLIKKRFPIVSQVDAKRIAEFSGGNARIAIALAGTVERGEDISGLPDANLFERLFRQQQTPDPALLRAAKALSLVYSFDGEDVSASGELARLGHLAGVDAVALYEHVVELLRRDLVQTRSYWRAVLPHAIANRLAAVALQDIHPAVLEVQLVATAPDRIKKSFSRRLGFLNDRPEAVRIVEKWLEPRGLLSDVAHLDGLRAEMFMNVAPVAPERALAAVERIGAGDMARLAGRRRTEVVRLLRSLAYDGGLFERSVKALVALAVTGREDEEDGGARDVVRSLFFAYLSGTHATIEQRLGVMSALVKSGNPWETRLGWDVLASLLEASHFSSSYDFEFGSHSRDHGYHPTFAEARAWFSAALAAAMSLLPSAPDVGDIIARKFRGLWSDAQVHGPLERASTAIAAKGFWREGWIAAKQTLMYDGPAMSSEVRARLVALENQLRPTNLVERVRSIVLSPSGKIDLDEYEEEDTEVLSGWERAAVLAGSLGEQLAVAENALSELLPEIVCGTGPRVASLGQGLVRGTPDAKNLWERLVAAFAAAPGDKRTVTVLTGFLRGLGDSNPSLAGVLLDSALQDAALGKWFAVLQTSVVIDTSGVERLRRALELGLAPIESFEHLAWGRAHESIPAADLSNLLARIAQKAGGVNVGLGIVFYRFFGDKEKKREPEPEIVSAGRMLLGKLAFEKGNARNDHELNVIVRKCASGFEGATIAKDLCERFKSAAARHLSDTYHYRGFLEALCKVQPATVLDVFFGGDDSQWRASIHLMRRFRNDDKHPLDAISESDVLAWCEGGSGERFQRVASVVSYLRGSPPKWSELAMELLKKAPNKVAVAKEFVARFRPSSWSGSRAAIMEGRMELLDELARSEDQDLASFAVAERGRYAAEIKAEWKFEADHDRETDERFE